MSGSMIWRGDLVRALAETPKDQHDGAASYLGFTPERNEEAMEIATNCNDDLGHEWNADGVCRKCRGWQAVRTRYTLGELVLPGPTAKRSRGA